MSRLTRWLRSRRGVPDPYAPPPDPNAPPPDPYEHLLYVPRYELCTVELAGGEFRLPDGASFYASHGEIFRDEIYRFPATDRAPRIVDCGANCGIGVVYFKSLYPQARIIAVEADPEIFELLKWNVARRGYADVALLNKAVAVGSEPVTFHRDGADAGRIHRLDRAKGQCTVPVVELDELLREPVDLLKIDIEGAETGVVCACTRLDAAEHVFLEYHSFADAPQSLHQVLDKLATSGFRYYLRTQFCPQRPLVEDDCYLGMDLQVNVFAKRIGLRSAYQLEDPVCGNGESSPDIGRAA